MAKILTDKELAVIFKKVTTEDHWIDDSSQYIKFLGDIAEVCADHFGGEVVDVSHRGGENLGYAITIAGDENIPEGGGVYAGYDADADWSGEAENFEDNKVLTDRELGQIIYDALTDEGVIDSKDQYVSFLEQLGTVIEDHFGGVRGGIDFDMSDELGYTVAFHINSSIPADGGIYKDYDTDVCWINGVEMEKPREPIFSQRVETIGSRFTIKEQEKMLATAGQIAEAYNLDDDGNIYPLLIDAANEMGLDKIIVEKGYEYGKDADFSSQAGVYFILTGESAPLMNGYIFGDHGTLLPLKHEPKAEPLFNQDDETQRSSTNSPKP